MNANDSVISFMAKCRRIQQELDSITVDQLIPQLALLNLTKERNVGTRNCFLADDPTMVDLTLVTLN